MPSKTAAPRIAGIDKSKENLAAVSLSNPKNLAAVMHIPDLLVPGKKLKLEKNQ